MPPKPNPSIKLDIIYEDEDIIVIDKPAGMLTHPLRSDQNDTLINALLVYCPTIKDVGDNSPTDELRPGIVHRLDKDTSGLIIAAKNNKSFEYLKNQFAQRKIEKHYLALVIGKIKDKKGIITKAISRSKKSGFKRSVLLDEKSKSAWTQYKVLKYFKDYTLLDVFPKTGRTHQIRVHLASIGIRLPAMSSINLKDSHCPKI